MVSEKQFFKMFQINNLEKKFENSWLVNSTWHVICETANRRSLETGGENTNSVNAQIAFDSERGWKR